MSQITREEFLTNWKNTQGISGAHFGILNALETREVSVTGWSAYYSSPSDPIDCIDFLIDVATLGDDDKRGAKALQVLLKHLQPSRDLIPYLIGEHEIYQRILSLLCLGEISHLIHRAPVSDLIRAFIGSYFQTMYRGYPFDEITDRAAYLKNWMRVVFVMGSVEILDKIPHEDVPMSVEILKSLLEAEAICKKDSKTLSEFVRKSDPSKAMRVKAVLYLMARHGDFDELIPL